MDSYVSVLGPVEGFCEHGDGIMGFDIPVVFFTITVLEIPSPRRALNVTRKLAEPLPAYLGLRTIQLQTFLLIHTWYPS